MSIFGPKPNAAFVVILYNQNPPSNAEQDWILSEISKRVGVKTKLIGTSEFMKENREPKELFDKYIEAECAIFLAKGNLYFLGKEKIRVDSFGQFTVATMTGRIDYSY
jgi:hypothetical protein